MAYSRTYLPAIRIVSGGQTGVDRAALDFAIENDIPHGGWCPRGRMAEDGRLHERYQLDETESSNYRQRTRRNIVDSDGTLIVARELPLTGGTLLTQRLATKEYRPVLVVVESESPESARERLRKFLEDEAIRVLNVAGPRRSGAPGIEGFVAGVLRALLEE